MTVKRITNPNNLESEDVLRYTRAAGLTSWQARTFIKAILKDYDLVPKPIELPNVEGAVVTCQMRGRDDMFVAHARGRKRDASGDVGLAWHVAGVNKVYTARTLLDEFIPTAVLAKP